MPETDYHKSFVAHAKRDLPDWQFDRLHKKARNSAGGTGKARARAASLAPDGGPTQDALVDVRMADPIAAAALHAWETDPAIGDLDQLCRAALALDPPPARAAHVAEAVQKSLLHPRATHVFAVRKDDGAAATVPEHVAPAIGTDPDQRLLYCVALEPDTLDTQDHLVSADDIQFAAHGFMQGARAIHTEHSHAIDAVPVESYIAPVDIAFDEGPFGAQVVRKGSWVVGIKVHDDAHWQRVKAGEYTGVSIGGVGTLSPA